MQIMKNEKRQLRQVAYVNARVVYYPGKAGTAKLADGTEVRIDSTNCHEMKDGVIDTKKRCEKPGRVNEAITIVLDVTDHENGVHPVVVRWAHGNREVATATPAPASSASDTKAKVASAVADAFEGRKPRGARVASMKEDFDATDLLSLNEMPDTRRAEETVVVINRINPNQRRARRLHCTGIAG